MAEALSEGRVSLRVLGTPEMNERVLALVFATKLASVVRAVEAADKSLNYGKRFNYVIADLKPTSAYAEIEEKVASQTPVLGSGVEAFGRCVEAVNEGRIAVAREWPDTVHHLKQLSRGSEKSFSHAELTINGNKPVRIDRFFGRQVEAAQQPIEPEESVPWFRGTTYSSFDGQILEVDLRGSTPKLKLLLTAGGIEIDCVYPGGPMEEIRSALKRRVRIRGKAFYPGTSGLPLRIEIQSIKVVGGGADIQRWRNSFEPFDLGEWENEY